MIQDVRNERQQDKLRRNNADRLERHAGAHYFEIMYAKECDQSSCKRKEQPGNDGSLFAELVGEGPHYEHTKRRGKAPDQAKGAHQCPRNSFRVLRPQYAFKHPSRIEAHGSVLDQLSHQIEQHIQHDHPPVAAAEAGLPVPCGRNLLLFPGPCYGLFCNALSGEIELRQDPGCRNQRQDD